MDKVISKKLAFLLLVFISISSLGFARNTKISGLKKDSLTGLYNKESLYQYLSMLKRTSSPPIYPLSIIELNSLDNIKEIGDLILRKGQDTILQNSRDSWTILLPNTQKKGTEVVLSRLRYHSDDFTVKNLRLIDSDTKVKHSDKNILKVLKNSQSYESSYSIVFIDIDNFKKINKQKGYNEGDKAIKLFADTLRLHVRKNDFIAKFGGDEFVFVFENTGKPAVRKIMRRLQDAEDQHQLSFSGGSVTLNKEMDPKLALEISMKLCQTAKDQVAAEANAEKMIFWDFKN